MQVTKPTHFSFPWAPGCQAADSRRAESRVSIGQPKELAMLPVFPMYADGNTLAIVQSLR